MFKESKAGYYSCILMDVRMPVMDEHLSKPIEPEKLYETMALLIKKRAQEAEQDAN